MTENRSQPSNDNPSITALVTGASGFIGSATVRELVKTGVKVIALCRNPEKGWRKLNGLGPGVVILPWNMAEPVVCRYHIDVVIHTAGQGDPATFSTHPAEAMRDHLFGAVHILDFAASRHVGKFVLISSGEIYGALGNDRKITEADQGAVSSLSPRSAYPMCKLAAESLTLAYWREHAVPACIVRLCHVYGPGIDRQDSRIACQFPLAAAEGRDIIMRSLGEQHRSLCYIDDAASGIGIILTRGRPGEAYNVADESSEVSVRQFAEEIAAVANVKVSFDIPDETQRQAFNPMPHAILSTEKLLALGWSPRIHLKEGIARTLSWFAGQD